MDPWREKVAMNQEAERLGVLGIHRGAGVWEPLVPGRGCGPGLGASGRPAGAEKEASYQTLSRRSNYCQLGTPRLCLCS